MIGNRKATVSLVMIVRNEEHQLAECLRPVAQLFDEIIVVDTGSTDATKQIARQFTPKVIDFAWCDDFSAARNESLRHATGEWVFWLDADDRLSAENLAKLESLLARLDDSRCVYLMDTVCWTEYAADGTTLISHPRLFRRLDGLRWTGRVHEQLRFSSGAEPLDAFASEVRIDHLGYQDRAAQQRKLQRNVRLLRMDYAINPDDESTLLHLGMSYFHLGRFHDAQEYLTRLVAGSRSGGDHFRQVYASLAQIALKLGQLPEALAATERGLAAFPSDEYLHYLRAECFYEMDDFASAQTELVNLIQQPRRNTYHGGVPGDVKEHIAPRRLADVLRLQRQFDAAEAICQTLLIKHPCDTHVWHTLGRIYLDAGNRDGLLTVVEKMRDCPQGDVFGALLLALWHLAQRELVQAGQQIEWLIAHAPQMPLPRILRIEWLGQTGASLDARMKACRDALRLQPGNLEVQRVLHSLEATQQAAAKSTHWPTLILGAGIPSGVTMIQ